MNVTNMVMILIITIFFFAALFFHLYLNIVNYTQYYYIIHNKSINH